MGKKKEYKEANRRFLKKLSFQEGVCALPCGIYYKVLETGESTISPGARSIVTVHYKGSLEKRSQTGKASCHTGHL